MNREKVILHIWSCTVIIFIAFYTSSFFLNTIKIYKLSNGTEITFDGAGLAEIVFICCVYHITKILLKK